MNMEIKFITHQAGIHMIHIKNLKFKYPNSLSYILDLPEFNLKKGEKVFLFGPSGCGKSTFLEILAGINIPNEGSISINNSEIQLMSATQRDRFRADYIGYIFQSFNLVPYLSVKENITLPLYFSELKRSHVLKENENMAVLEICKRLGIEQLLDKAVTELSIGQQQRVAAARAMIGKPKLILADEPTSSLDFDHREKFIQLLFSVCNELEISVLFVSHDRSLEKLFDRSVSLQEINLASKKNVEVNL